MQDHRSDSGEPVDTAELRRQLREAAQARASAEGDVASLSLRYTAAEERASTAESRAQVSSRIIMRMPASTCYKHGTPVKQELLCNA